MTMLMVEKRRSGTVNPYSSKKSAHQKWIKRVRTQDREKAIV